MLLEENKTKTKRMLLVDPIHTFKSIYSPPLLEDYYSILNQLYFPKKQKKELFLFFHLVQFST